MKTLADAILWVRLHTQAGVAQRLLDQHLELQAYRDKFSMHEYRGDGVIGLKAEVGLVGEETGKYQRVPFPELSPKEEILTPEDWRLVTLTKQPVITQTGRQP